MSERLPRPTSDDRESVRQEAPSSAPPAAQRAAAGTEALPEFMGELREITPTRARAGRYQAGLLAVLREAGRPLPLAEITRLVKTRGAARPKSGSATETARTKTRLRALEYNLAAMVRLGDIVKVAHGVYALPEFADNKPYKRASEQRLRLAAVLQEAGRPLPLAEITRLVNKDSPDEIRLCNLRYHLSVMLEAGDACRVEQGVYALPEFAGQEYVKVRRRAYNWRIMAILRSTRRPLHCQEIYGQLREDDAAAKVSSMRTALTLLRSAGDIVRVSYGVYALPEFANILYEPRKSPTRAEQSRLKLATVLWEAGRPLRLAEVARLFGADSPDELQRGVVERHLSAMVRLGEILRLERGVYSLPEFAEVPLAVSRTPPAEAESAKAVEHPLPKQVDDRQEYITRLKAVYADSDPGERAIINLWAERKLLAGKPLSEEDLRGLNRQIFNNAGWGLTKIRRFIRALEEELQYFD